MGFILFILDLMIPLTIVAIVGYGLLKKSNVYDSFLEGAMEGMKITFNILPTLVGLMVAVGVLRASGNAVGSLDSFPGRPGRVVIAG